MKNYVIVLVVLALALTMVVAAPDPGGATLTNGLSSRGTDPSVNSFTAAAGNTTPLNLDQNKITDVWQGFYGNVSGQIVLENAAGDNFYDWQYVNITGEVYATRNQVADWSAINCSNSTHWEAEESTLNIASTAIDGINETFNQTNHPAFSVGTRLMTGCRSTKPYQNGGTPGEFWNVLLNSNSTNTVYVSILANDATDFEGGTSDFELLVPVDRIAGTILYYFYAELK